MMRKKIVSNFRFKKIMQNDAWQEKVENVRKQNKNKRGQRYEIM